MTTRFLRRWLRTRSRCSLECPYCSYIQYDISATATNATTDQPTCARCRRTGPVTDIVPEQGSQL